MSHNQQQEQQVLVTCRLLNVNNLGSILCNKKLVIAYCNVETDLEGGLKTIIGCFINPADLVLSHHFDPKQSTDSLLNNNMFYFKTVIDIFKLFNIERLLKTVIWNNSYQNSITKKILYEKHFKIISYCEYKVKEKVFNY